MKSLIFLALIGFAAAQYRAPASAPLEDERPKPYSFTYDTTDEFGVTLTRSESGDEQGNVKGTYTYRDNEGLYRVVDYVSDAGGFRATVRTNEPGTGKGPNGSDPADTVWEIEQPPAGVVEKWTNRQPARTYRARRR